jgi:ABC-type glycerol-3-phosphate transport system substrate-binding protein
MRSARTNSALLLLVVSIAAAAAGCGGGGGSSNNSAQPFSDYETKMQALGAKLGAAISATGNKNISANAAAIEHNLQHVQVLLRNAATKLEAITPPKDVADAHAQLIAAVREYATELGTIIKRLKGGAGRNALAGIFTLPGIKAMQQASQTIEKAGYAIVVG